MWNINTIANSINRIILFYYTYCYVTKDKLHTFVISKIMDKGKVNNIAFISQMI